MMLAEEMREFLCGLTDAERKDLRRELRFFGVPDECRQAIERFEEHWNKNVRECKKLERSVREIGRGRRISR